MVKFNPRTVQQHNDCIDGSVSSESSVLPPLSFFVLKNFWSTPLWLLLRRSTEARWHPWALVVSTEQIRPEPTSSRDSRGLLTPPASETAALLRMWRGWGMIVRLIKTLQGPCAAAYLVPRPGQGRRIVVNSLCCSTARGLWSGKDSLRGNLWSEMVPKGQMEGQRVWKSYMEQLKGQVVFGLERKRPVGLEGREWAVRNVFRPLGDHGVQENIFIKCCSRR